MPLKRIALVGSLATVALLAVLVGGWWFFVRGDASPATSSRQIDDEVIAGLTPTAAPTTPAEPPTATSTPTAEGVEVFTIVVDQSKASYFADEKLASLPTSSTAEGITTIEGTFYLTSEGLDPTNETSFTVDLAGLRSDQGMRDNRVRQALEVTRFPTATFVATSLEGYPGEFPADGSEIEMLLTGILDLHGVQKEVTWEVKARRQGDIISAIATINFRYEEFDIPILNIAGFVSVEEDVTLQANIIAVKS